MKKSFMKKTAVALLSVSMLMATACNSKIDVKYDYNVEDYVQLGQYENISVQVDKTSIENELIESKIKQDVEDNTTYTEVDRGAIASDQILVTYTATSSGASLSGLTNTDGKTMILGTDTLGLELDELDQALYGMTAGQTKILIVDIPEDYSSDLYKGTRVVFELTMQTVAQANVPMITNAYVKEAFGYDTVEEYRQSIKESLETDINSKVENKIQEDVLSSLQDTFKISSYPDSLMEETRSRLETSIGLSFDDFVKKSVVQQLIMEAIVKDRNMTMREYDYKGSLDDFAADNGYSNADTFVEKFGKDKSVKAMLVQKAQDYVIEHANIEYK